MNKKVIRTYFDAKDISKREVLDHIRKKILVTKNTSKQRSFKIG